MGVRNRLRRIERRVKTKGPRSYIFTIDKGERFETREELDEELTKMKYDNKVVIIDNVAKMRAEMERRRMHI